LCITEAHHENGSAFVSTGAGFWQPNNLFQTGFWHLLLDLQKQQTTEQHHHDV